MSSCSGAIGHILFVLTTQMFQDQGAIAERLLCAARDFPRISLIGRGPLVEPAKALLARLGLEARSEIIVPPDHAELHGWVQDRFAICEAGADRERVVVEPACGRGGDTARHAAMASGIAGRDSAGFWFEGGNVLADADDCFLGADIRDRAQRNGPDRADDAFLDRVANDIECRRKIHIIGCRAPIKRRGPVRFEIAPGNLAWRQDVDRSVSWDGSRQPVFHIDMFMTLAGHSPEGRSRVLLGDPIQASALIGAPLPDGFPTTAFDEIDAELRRAGCEVIRNPLPFVYFDDPDSRLREWFYASANNCWVERHRTGRGRVWLPEYGFGDWPELKATDDANAAIWHGLGFDVVRAGDFLPLVDQLGSLNCVSKILEREA